MSRLLATLAVAAALTIALSPRFNRWLWYRIQPPTPADWAPKYVIGGRIVTKEEFNA